MSVLSLYEINIFHRTDVEPRGSFPAAAVHVPGMITVTQECMFNKARHQLRPFWSMLTVHSTRTSSSSCLLTPRILCRGANPDDSALKVAVRYAQTAGQLFVTAAGRGPTSADCFMQT